MSLARGRVCITTDKDSAMLRVVLTTGNESRPRREEGHIDFLRLPVESSKDFVISPPGIASFEDAQCIAGDLRDRRTSGKIEGYQWRAQ
jgi:hypothetical protein